MKYYPEIDFIKALAIISVVLLHLLAFNGSREFLFKIMASFHIWQAVPVFMFIFGFTLRLSIDNGSNAIKIFFRRMIRFLLPLSFAYLIAFGIKYILNYKGNIDWHILIGQLPTPGMGTYFITLYFEAILASIFLYYLVKKFQFYTVLIIAILISILGESIAVFIDYKDFYLYSSSIHRYIVLIVLGYYFSEYKYDKKQYLLIAFGIISLILLSIFQYYEKPIWPYSEYRSSKLWQFQHFPYAFYTFYLVSLLTYIYSKIDKIINKNFSFILNIGKASLHIFLTQIFIFFIEKQMKLSMDLKLQFFTFALIFGIGYLWYYSENLISKKWIEHVK